MRYRTRRCSCFDELTVDKEQLRSYEGQVSSGHGAGVSCEGLSVTG